MGAPRNTLRVFNAGVSLCRLVCRRPQAAKPVLRRGSSRSAFPLWGKAQSVEEAGVKREQNTGFFEIEVQKEGEGEGNRADGNPATSV